MLPYDHAVKFYGLIDWMRLLERYASHHYVYSSPTALCLAKPEGDSWFIEFAAGDIQELICHLPFWLTYIRFSVKGKSKVYATARLVNRFLKDATIEDGPADALPRWRWWQWEDQTHSAALTHYRSRECGQDTDSGQAA
jgi:hypothetical protein